LPEPLGREKAAERAFRAGAGGFVRFGPGDSAGRQAASA